MPARSFKGDRTAAVLASVVVHGLAAWGLAGLRAQSPPSLAPTPAIEVMLVTAFPRADRPPATPRSEAAAQAAPLQPPLPPGRTATPAAPQAAAPTAFDPPVRTAPVSPTPAPPSHVEADPLSAYRQQVWAQLNAAAPKAGSKGAAARLGFGLDAAGGLTFVRLVRSSGDPKFDRSCLAAVRAAAPFPPPPPVARIEDLVFEVPIRPRPSMSFRQAAATG